MPACHSHLSHSQTWSDELDNIKQNIYLYIISLTPPMKRPKE